MKRRHLLELGAAAALSVPLLRPWDQDGAPELAATRLPGGAAAARRGPVAVIGAGAAGLAAADALHRAGVEVFVLEARPRLGGRILTDRSLGVPVDLGAAWVHGRSRLWRMVERAGLRFAATTDYASFVAFDVDGARLGRRELVGPLARFEVAQRVLERAARGPGGDASVAATLDAAGALDGLTGRPGRVTDFLFYTALQQPFAVDPELLSVRRLPAYYDYRGGEYLPADGMDGLLRLLDAGPTVHRGVQVQAVTVTATGVRMSTSAGEFEAARCICTVPLAVLRRGAVRFTPSLPDDVRRALDRLVVGDFFKLALRFEGRFWDGDVDFTASIGAAGRYGSGRHVGFLHLDRAHRDPVLVMIAGARVARDLELAGPDQATEFAQDRLRRAYGDDVPRPLASLATGWTADPLTGGAYSGYGVGATADDVRAFHRLVGDRLTFAGEHTSLRIPSTVHGAVDSGYRAAATVLGS